MGADTGASVLTSVPAVLLNAAERFGKKVWLIDRSSPAAQLTLTFEQLVDRVGNLAQRLHERGVRTGDHVALSMSNTPEFLLCWFAVNWLGAAIVPLNTALKTKEAGYIIGHSGASTWIREEDLPASTLEIGSYHRLKHVISSHEIADMSSGDRWIPPVDIGHDDRAAILYTSGTTGDPKGCSCPHRYYTTTGQRLVEQLNVTAGDRFALYLPLFHMNAQTCTTMGSLISGASISLWDKFHAKDFFDRLIEDEITIANYIGGIPSMLAAQPPGELEKKHSLRVMFGGGMTVKDHIPFEERFGIPCVEFYGMTETGLCIGTSLADRMTGTGSCGLPLSGVEARLVDQDGKIIQGDGVGVLEVKGSGLFSGYFQSSERDFDHEGWFRTGDVLWRRGDAYGFVDRARDIIRRSGENISAREVEAVLSSHPLVKECAVVGVPDDFRGQEVKAVIVLAGNADHDQAERTLRSFMGETLAEFKVPKYFEFRTAIPRTATERVQKHLL